MGKGGSRSRRLSRTQLLGSTALPAPRDRPAVGKMAKSEQRRAEAGVEGMFMKAQTAGKRKEEK